MNDLNLGQSVQHFKLFSPNRRCQRHVPGGKEVFESLLPLPVDEALGLRLKAGLLWLRWPLGRLRLLSLPLEFPFLTKLTSVSSSLKAAVNEAEEALVEEEDGGRGAEAVE